MNVSPTFCHLASLGLMAAAIQTRHVPALQASLACAALGVAGWVSLGAVRYTRGEIKLMELFATCFMAALAGFCVYAFFPRQDFIQTLAYCALAGLAPVETLNWIRSRFTGGSKNGKSGRDEDLPP